MMHTMDRYFSVQTDNALTDGMAEALLRTVMENAPIALKEPENYKARAEILWASSLAHNGLMNCGGPKGDWACHQLEHELGGMFDVAHGAGLAAVWAAGPGTSAGRSPSALPSLPTASSASPARATPWRRPWRALRPWRISTAPSACR